MRVSKMTVYRLVHNGELPAVRVGRSFRVHAKAVHDMLESSYFDARRTLFAQAAHRRLKRPLLAQAAHRRLNALRASGSSPAERSSRKRLIAG